RPWQRRRVPGTGRGCAPPVYCGPRLLPAACGPGSRLRVREWLPCSQKLTIIRKQITFTEEEYPMRTLKLLAAMVVPALLAAPLAQAQSSKFPEKPIRLIIGSAPGSGPDIISRLLADRLYETWKQRIVVDSRPGAAGAIS